MPEQWALTVIATRLVAYAAITRVTIPGCGAGVLPDGALIVTLEASNTSPNVGEAVLLTCVVFGIGAQNATREFAGSVDRLDIDAISGTATLIPAASDVGAALAFRCTATGTDGTSFTSNEVLVIPVS